MGWTAGVGGGRRREGGIELVVCVCVCFYFFPFMYGTDENKTHQKERKKQGKE